jgi:hypothetical protein
MLIGKIVVFLEPSWRVNISKRYRFNLFHPRKKEILRPCGGRLDAAAC